MVFKVLWQIELKKKENHYDTSRIPIQISLKFVPKNPIDNKPALVQVMA